MKRLLFLFVSCCLLLNSQMSYAQYGWGHRSMYDYHGGHYWLGGTIVGALAVGALVVALNQPKVVIVNGYRYYYDGTYYYTRTQDGYIVVQPPVVQPMPMIIEQPAPIIVHAVPRDFIPVQFRGQTYFVKNDRWFINTESGLQQVPDPTRY